jgi:hypothetical protein
VKVPFCSHRFLRLSRKLFVKKPAPRGFVYRKGLGENTELIRTICLFGWKVSSEKFPR